MLSLAAYSNHQPSKDSIYIKDPQAKTQYPKLNDKKAAYSLCYTKQILELKCVHITHNHSKTFRFF